MSDDHVNADALALRQRTDHLIALTNHPGFKILTEEMEAFRRVAMEDLLMADPTDAKEIMRLQQIIAACRWWTHKLEELIQKGMSEEDLAELDDGEAGSDDGL